MADGGLRERVLVRMKALGLTPRAASLKANLGSTAVRDLFRRPDSSPAVETLRKLASGLETTPEWLAYGSDAGPEDAPEIDAQATSSETMPRRSRMVRAHFGGLVEAGSFREVADFEDDPDRDPYWVPIDTMFPDLPLHYFDVRGDSMNALEPRPLIEGDRVVCLDFEALGGRVPMRDGLVVVVEQTKDGGLLRERSIKQIEVRRDRTEFHPRSTNKRHKPIVVARGGEEDPLEGRQVRILALVRDIVFRVSLL